MIEHVTLGEQGQPERFMRFLKDEVTWLHEEVVSEVKAERLELTLDDHVTEEAASLIHRHFGRSRRFSERDKKMMTSLVATRTQVAMEIWKRRMTEVTRSLDKVKATLKKREESIQAISDAIEAFLRQNQAELYDFSRDMKSTSQILLETGYGEGNDVFGHFLRKVSSMLDKLQRVLFERESLLRQKKLCMSIIERKDLQTPLDQMVRDRIRIFQMEKEQSEREVEKLQERLTSLDLAVKEKDRHIGKLREEVADLKSVDGAPCHANLHGQSDLQSHEQTVENPKLQSPQKVKEKYFPTLRDSQPDKVDGARALPLASPGGKVAPTRPLKSKTSHGGRHFVLPV